jgi:hypothetical protein
LRDGESEREREREIGELKSVLNEYKQDRNEMEGGGVLFRERERESVLVQ